MFRWQLAEQLASSKVIAIVRTASAAKALDIGTALLRAGLPAVEITLTVPRALSVIADLVAVAPEGSLVGAGTVIDAPSASAAISAGASFLVTPGVREEVVRTAARHGRATVVGAATASEGIQALEHGADLIKLFPARALGIDTMQALRSALPQAALVPTGGIEVDEIEGWLSAGATAVGIGGALTRGDAGEATREAHRLLAHLRSGDIAG